MPRWAVTMILVIAVTGCGGPLKLLTGGGPNIAANVQAGRTNTQTVGTTKNESLTQRAGDNAIITRTTETNKVRTEVVERVIVNERTPPWIWLLVIAGWMLPSPGEMARGVRAFRRKEVAR